MTFAKRFTSLCLLAFTALNLSGCDKKDEPIATPAPKFGDVMVEMDNVVGNLPLVLDATTYTTTAGDPFTVSIFNYYISNVKFTKADGSSFAVPESYFLVKQSVPASRSLKLEKVPEGDYTGMTFTIGVDSTRNVSGAQTGALSPSENMFWTWNSGYIFTKLEGTSTASPTGALTFHIGGFRTPNNTIRTVSPSFNGSTLKVRADHSPEIHVKANALKMFEGPNEVRFATLYNTMGGPNSVKVASNYASGMFRVDHIHAN